MAKIYFFKPKKSTENDVEVGSSILIYSHDSELWQFADRTVGKVIEISSNLIRFQLIETKAVDAQDNIYHPVKYCDFLINPDNVYHLPKEFIVDVKYED